MADAGLCSRREAERWIVAGRVQVNGVVLTTPACVVGDDDKVQVDGQLVAGPQAVRVWAYYKPVGEVCSTADEKGRVTVFQRLEKLGLPRVVGVGRLDVNSEGLLLVTTSGALAGQLMKSDVARVYRVRVKGDITGQQVKQAQHGLVIEGEHFAPINIELEKGTGLNRWYRFTLTEGKNREIRRVVEFFGGQVNRLVRVRYGSIALEDLEKGRVRELTAQQVKVLQRG